MTITVEMMGTADGTSYARRLFEENVKHCRPMSGVMTPFWNEKDARSGWESPARAEANSRLIAGNSAAYCKAFVAAAQVESVRLHRAALGVAAREREAEQAAMIREGEYRADREGTENL